MALDNIVFQAAADNGVEQVVYTSSACVYPTDIQRDRQLLHESMVSFSERGGAYADEEYGWAKLMGELSLRAYHRQYGLDAASARLSTAYGPRENESHALIALIAKAFARQDPFEIWGSGEQTRGFTYVDDIVEGVLRAALHIHDGTVVNVGTDEFVSLNRIAETIFDVVGWRPANGIHHDLDKPVGVQHRALDISHARARTGWYPETPLRHGIERTVEWYARHRDIEDVTRNLQTLLMER
jgi:UDP-glucose 4-epimerase